MAQIMADDGPSLPPPRVVDIGINLTHKAFRKHWKHVVKRAIDAGVDTILLTGTSIDRSKESLGLAQQWKDDEKCSNLFVTVGVHPHDANTWKSSGEEEQTTLEQMRKMLKHPLAVAVGECGLDYNRNFSSKPHQIHAFREQIRLACELNMPIFVHEREAHEDLILIVDQVRDENKERPLPPICIHCFTGTEQEALEYVKRGYYIGFTGTICKKKRGAPLRELLSKLPIQNIMVETDAPFMGFKKERRSSEPADCVDVARKLSETVGLPFEQVCQTTTANALQFFNIPNK